MDDLAPLIENISRKIKLDQENLDRLLDAFTMVKVKKSNLINLTSEEEYLTFSVSLISAARTTYKFSY